MAVSSAVGVYENFADAEQAVRLLDRGGFPVNRISIIAQDMQSEKDVHGYIGTGDLARSGAGTGAWLGGVFGILFGAAFLWVPGFGPLMVAGPFAAALLGGVEGVALGAAGGGLLGSLVGWGVSRKHILKYEEHLRGGRYLLVAHGSRDQVNLAREILESSAPIEVQSHEGEHEGKREGEEDKAATTEA
jgi:hypothetical protein